MSSLSRMMRCGVVLVFLSLTGCSASSQAVFGPPSSVSNSVSDLQSSQSVSARSSSPSVSSLPSSDAHLEKLAALWARRSNEKTSSDFPIGSGDIIEISVPAIEELRSRTVRIGGDGIISLPFIGKLEATGLTEQELQESSEINTVQDVQEF